MMNLDRFFADFESLDSPVREVALGGSRNKRRKHSDVLSSVDTLPQIVLLTPLKVSLDSTVLDLDINTSEVKIEEASDQKKIVNAQKDPVLKGVRAEKVVVDAPIQNEDIDSFFSDPGEINFELNRDSLISDSAQSTVLDMTFSLKDRSWINDLNLDGTKTLFMPDNSHPLLKENDKNPLGEVEEDKNKPFSKKDDSDLRLKENENLEDKKIDEKEVLDDSLNEEVIEPKKPIKTFFKKLSKFFF